MGSNKIKSKYEDVLLQLLAFLTTRETFIDQHIKGLEIRPDLHGLTITTYVKSIIILRSFYTIATNLPIENYFLPGAILLRSALQDSLLFFYCSAPSRNENIAESLDRIKECDQRAYDLHVDQLCRLAESYRVRYPGVNESAEYVNFFNDSLRDLLNSPIDDLNKIKTKLKVRCRKPPNLNKMWKDAIFPSLPRSLFEKYDDFSKLDHTGGATLPFMNLAHENKTSAEWQFVHSLNVITLSLEIVLQDMKNSFQSDFGNLESSFKNLDRAISCAMGANES